MKTNPNNTALCDYVARTGVEEANVVLEAFDFLVALAIGFGLHAMQTFYVCELQCRANTVTKKLKGLFDDEAMGNGAESARVIECLCHRLQVSY